MLMAVSKMLTDMERSGDEAEKVATVARRIHEGELRHFPVIELRHMAANAHHAAPGAGRSPAWIRSRPRWCSDKEVDKEWKGALRHLITYMIEDPRTISRSIDMIFIAARSSASAIMPRTCPSA